jgi:hypothetical protein
MSEEKKDLTTFEKVFGEGNWIPIHNCPGRFRMIGGRSEIPVENLAESENPVVEFLTEIVPDKVLTMEFTDGGGIISYVKEDGTFIHTLNTKEGFERKLEHLKGGKNN